MKLVIHYDFSLLQDLVRYAILKPDFCILFNNIEICYFHYIFQNKSQGLNFVRIHATWQVLSREAELLKIKMPTKKVNIFHFISTSFIPGGRLIRNINVLKLLEVHYSESLQITCNGYFFIFLFCDDLVFRVEFQMGISEGISRATEAAHW